MKNGRVDELERVAHKLSVPLEVEDKRAEWGYVALPEKQDATDTDADQEAADADRIREKVVVQGRAVEAGKVPSVVGMGLKDAIFLLESQGLKVAFYGRGRVVSQSLPAGAPVVRGQVVSLKLEI